MGELDKRPTVAIRAATRKIELRHLTQSGVMVTETQVTQQHDCTTSFKAKENIEMLHKY